jgi:hypothetical protein
MNRARGFELRQVVPRHAAGCAPVPILTCQVGGCIVATAYSQFPFPFPLATLASCVAREGRSPPLSAVELFLHESGDGGGLFGAGVAQAQDGASDVGGGMVLVEFEFHLDGLGTQLEAHDALQA